jgi:hypothetical protein
MRRLFLLFACFIFSVKLFATAQVPDYLIIDNDTIRIHSNPLEQYFEKHPLPIPANGIVSASTGNWRGYVAFFKFHDNKLVVENIYKEQHQNETGKYEYKLISIYKDVFGEAQNFPCDFYTGLLICPYGKMLNYVHMGYGSTFEYYKLFEIKDGIKIKAKDFLADEYNKFKLDYFKYYKTTQAYKDEYAKMKEVMSDVDKNMPVFEDDEPKSKRKENKYLKQKEAEFNLEKELDSFMFFTLDNYMNTIDIPNKQ